MTCHIDGSRFGLPSRNIRRAGMDVMLFSTTGLPDRYFIKEVRFRVTDDLHIRQSILESMREMVAEEENRQNALLAKAQQNLEELSFFQRELDK